MPLPAKPSVLVTGGTGYVGSALIPKLLEAGHSVTVLDLYVYGGHVFGDFHGHENLRGIKGDLRDLGVVEDAVNGADAVIHLACISNDPSFELDPNLGKSINFDAFRPLVRALANYDLDRAAREIERVGNGPKYIMVESFRTEAEKANLLYWQLTCRAFHSPEEWEWLLGQAGYTGDYGCIYFE